MYKNVIFSICICVLVLTLSGCKQPDELKVAASAVPHAEMLEHIQPELKQAGIKLTIVVSDDYNMPNRALAEHAVDANFFQHANFLAEQIKQFHYPIESIAKIELEPMGLYSKKVRTIAELQAGAVIAVPNDPTNEARALLLLQQHGLLQLKDPKQALATILDIAQNPHQFKFVEVDTAMLARSLPDVDAAVVNTNYALQANLHPAQDALILEDQQSPYANVLVIRAGDSQRADIQALIKALTSDKMREFILQHYKGAVVPAF